MPTKPLPASLVRRLRRTSKKIDLALSRMKNKDHRTADQVVVGHTPSIWGYRVRGMNVKRNYPKTKLIIKKAQTGVARAEIRYVQRKVRDYNRLPKESRPHCILLMPKAYAIGEDLVAMREAPFPAADELAIFPEFSPYDFRTPRGAQWEKKLAAHGIDAEEFRQRIRMLLRLTGITPGNLMVLGARKNQLVLMPLVDQL